MPINKIKIHIGDKFEHVISWLEYLTKTQKTQIICWNLLRDLEFNGSPKDALEIFLRELDEAIKSDVDFVRTNIRDAFTTLRKKLGNDVCLKGKLIKGSLNEDCCFKLSEGHQPIDGLSRVVSYIKFQEQRKYEAPYFLEDESESAIIKKGKTQLCLDSKHRGFLFVTTHEEVREHLRAVPIKEKWTKLIRRLGIPNDKAKKGNDSVRYALICYPEFFKPGRLTKPTFIDAGEKFEFCLTPEGHNGWGKTLDLDDGSQGLSEAVHCPYGITEVEYEIFDASVSPSPDYNQLLDVLRI